MHKKYSTTHLKGILGDVLSIAFQHMGAMAKELNHLNITLENVKDKTDAEKSTSATLNHILTIINDVIHPAHDIAAELFDKDISEFVDFCIKNQALAIEKKLISPVCKCHACKLKSIN